MSHSPHYRIGLVCAIVGAIAFSGKAIIVKMAYRHGADAMTLLMLRMLFALPLFLMMAWWSGRGKSALTPVDWLGVVGLGFIGYYLSSYLDFLGLRYISASLERLILYLNPTIVLLLAWVLYGKRISLLKAAAMAFSYLGILLVFGQEVSMAGSDVFLGVGLVFLSAVSYAIYLTYSGHIVKSIGAMRLAGLATAVACLFCIAQFMLFRPLDFNQLTPPIIWLSVVNAMLCTALPVLMVMIAVERIGPALTSQIGMIGPISTLAMGILFLNEPLTIWVMAGTALVIGGVYLVTKFGQQKTFITKESNNV